MEHTLEQRAKLLDLARASVSHGLANGAPLPVTETDFEPALREVLATFVTLRLRGELQGCIGMLRASRPLIRDVVDNAYSAAFNDPRGIELTAADIAELDIHISILTPPEPLTIASEDDLVRTLRPGIDGLILEDHGQRGTLLPSVWENLPDPRAFINHVKVKAGWRESYWSATIKVSRYQTECFGKE